jgi:SAM-dependent methyltransferase
MLPNCPLCGGCSTLLTNYRQRHYYRCNHCHSAFADPQNLLSFEDERNRYLKHNNDVFDPGYRDFVEPIISLIFERYTPNHKGFDYGSGSGSAISQILTEKSYCIEQYDPYFCNNIELLRRTYDYIVCCEVIEHFYNPHKEFRQLRSMLNPGGELICMTHIYTESVDFVKWYYKDDITHVFFYHPKSISYIQSEFGFNDAVLNNRTVRFAV